jgi:hypothetical protein
MKKVFLVLVIAVIAMMAVGLMGYTIARANGLDVRDVISGVSRPYLNRVNNAPMEHRFGHRRGFWSDRR